MPVNTNTQSQPPDVEVEVDDDPGGGVRRRHVADVVVSWDPKYLRYRKSSPAARRCHVNRSGGHVVWKKQDIPGSGKTYRLRFERKKPGLTYVCATATDTELGQTHGSCASFTGVQPTTKKKAKKKKKAKRKVTKRKVAKRKVAKRRTVKSTAGR